MINLPEQPFNDEARHGARIASIDVCGCISTHPGLPHEKVAKSSKLKQDNFEF